MILWTSWWESTKKFRCHERWMTFEPCFMGRKKAKFYLLLLSSFHALSHENKNWLSPTLKHSLRGSSEVEKGSMALVYDLVSLGNFIGLFIAIHGRQHFLDNSVSQSFYFDVMDDSQWSLKWNLCIFIEGIRNNFLLLPSTRSLSIEMRTENNLVWINCDEHFKSSSINVRIVTSDAVWDVKLTKNLMRIFFDLKLWFEKSIFNKLLLNFPTLQPYPIKKSFLSDFVSFSLYFLFKTNNLKFLDGAWPSAFHIRY